MSDPLTDIFTICVDFVLSESIEGGLSDHPKDRGGRTNRGVTQRRLYRAIVDHPELELPSIVDNLTREQAVAIYRAGEWEWVKGYLLPRPLAILAFDCAVNSGAQTAVELMQAALRVKRDGILGPITFKAAQTSDAKAVAMEYAAQRALHYAYLKQFQTFGKGWMRRLFVCYTLAIEGL